jgi:hypothetical protein
MRARVMRAAWIVVAAALAVAGCGGGAGTTGTGGHAAGGAGPGGAGAGAGGHTGGAGSGGAAGAGANGGLPACATVDAPPQTGDAGTCESFLDTGALVNPEPLTPGDGGVILDGGAFEMPAGGAIVDGDYDLVRLQTNVAGATRRTIRVFQNGGFIEWVGALNATAPDGGAIEFLYDTHGHTAGSTLFIDQILCEPVGNESYGYTATGDELVLFANTSSGIIGVDTYRRTCNRP